MRAILMHEAGGPDVLRPGKVPVPEAGAGQVLVRIEAIGVSQGETLLRQGKYPFPKPLPAVFGAEGGGVVEQVGDGADPELNGARVVFTTGGAGSYAEYVAVDTGTLARVPEGLTIRDAVATGAPGTVAFALLHRAALREGETVLVEAASGRVGGYLVRHAREFGAGRIIATAGTPEGRERVRALGADVVLDHHDPKWTDELDAVDVAFEAIGGAAARQVLAALAPDGRMLVYGLLSGRPPELDGAQLTRGLQVRGCFGPQWTREVYEQRYPGFLARLAAGTVAGQAIHTVLPLNSATEAHELAESTRGRVLLDPAL